MSPRHPLCSPFVLGLALLLLPAAASSAKEEKKDSAPPAKAIRVAILPFINTSPEVGATRIMDDTMRGELKKLGKDRAIFLMPADVERVLADQNQLDRVYRITEKWSRSATLDSTAIGGLDSLLQIDAVLCVKVSEWETHRVPVIGAGQSSSTVALSLALYDVRTKARVWSKNPREQRYAAELDASSAAVNYDETGFIQRKQDSSPPRIEIVAADLVRDAFKHFPTR